MPAVRWLDAVPSTQEVAHLLAESGAPHGTAVAAREQLAGRGTRGRAWHSPIGGLWMSVICRPGQAASAECFSVRVGLAVARAIEELEPAVSGLMLKWPNDIYHGGRKLGGILCEARWQGAELGWIVAGIGMNVSNAVPPEVAGTATRLGSIAPGIALEALADRVAGNVADRAGTGGPLDDTELAEFARRDFLLGRLVHEPVTGVARGIDSSGALRVEESGGAVRMALAGTVVLG